MTLSRFCQKFDQYLTNSSKVKAQKPKLRALKSPTAKTLNFQHIHTNFLQIYTSP